MPVYMYRREDGTTFEYRQKFSEEPLTTDPETGQAVVRVVQSAGIIFRGSGFYVNDSKGSKKGLSGSSNGKDAKADAPKGDAKADAPKADAPKADAPKADAPKTDTGKAASSAAS